MPKSFLFTRHKRYEYDFQEEAKSSNKTPPPPPTKYPIELPIKIPFIKSEPTSPTRSEVISNFKSRSRKGDLEHLHLIPSWVSPVTLPVTSRPIKKIEANEVDIRCRDEDMASDKYFNFEDNNNMRNGNSNGRYTRLKIPALVPVRRDWKSIMVERAFKVHDEKPLMGPTPICQEIDEDQPVNLSVKKVDLFNLNRLAEVSLATAEAEGRTFSSTSRDPSPMTSSSSSPNPGVSKNAEDYEMGDLRICESPIPNDNVMKVEPLTLEIQFQSSDDNIPSPTNGVMLDLPLKPINEVSNSVSSSSSNSNNTACTGRHKCLECGKGFSTLSNLARHRQTHRSLSDSSAVKKCPHCDKVYVSMPAFSMHLRTHNQGCKCPYCGKGFSRPWLLQGHIRTHTGEKPFKCPICAKAFADKSNLRAHTQTHSSEKPFICNRCGKPFALKSYLCKHIESSCMKTSRSSSEKTNSPKSVVDPSGNGDSSCSSFSGPTEEGSNDNYSS